MLPSIMTIKRLSELLVYFENKGSLDEDYQIWLSSDEEGNEITPMNPEPEISIEIDSNQKRIILFPCR